MLVRTVTNFAAASISRPILQNREVIGMEARLGNWRECVMGSTLAVHIIAEGWGRLLSYFIGVVMDI